MGITAVDVIQVKYKHFITYLTHIPEIEAYLTKKGAKVHGFFAVEAGGSDEVVVISTWDSVDARAKAHDEIDEEGMKLHKCLAKCIQQHHNVLAFPNPEVKKPEHPTPPKRIRMNVYNVHGNPMTEAHKYIDLVKEFKKQIPELESELRAILHPIAFTGAYNLVTVFDEGTSVDHTMEAFLKFMKDPANSDKIKTVYDHYHPVASRMLKRIEPEKIAKLKKMAEGCH